MKRKSNLYIDPRTNHARSWRDCLPVQPAQQDDPLWLKIVAVLTFLVLLIAMAIV